MPQLTVTELDFQTIKQNLKQYLSSQEQFSDYNFEGSGLTLILDVLAYNTHYNAVLAHLVANEMFLDSAVKRSSVVSHAKALGYVPRSASAASARLKITVPAPSVDAPASLVLNRSVPFIGQGEQSLTFFPDTEYVARLDGDSYVFPEVRVLQGTRSASQFLVETDTRSGPFMLDNSNIDTSTIRVQVQESGAVSRQTYSSRDSIINVTPNDRVYWVEEGPGGRIQLLFGDGTFGFQMPVGAVVTVDYLVTAGDGSANGTSSFSLGAAIAGQAAASVVVLQAAAGGGAPESVDSIRQNAPRFHSARNRAVTAEDYKSLIMALYPYAKSVQAWGGEDNVPPIYGKVFITVEPKSGYAISQADREVISRTILNPRRVLGISHEFVDPDYLYIGLDVQVSFDALRSSLSSSALESLIKSEIGRYFSDEVSTLDQSMYYSRLLQYIDATDPSIIGSQVSLTLQRRVQPTQNVPTRIVSFFNTQVKPGSVYSSAFRASVNSVEYLARLQDNGAGVLQLVTAAQGTVLANDVGSVDYNTGYFSVRSITVLGYISGMQELRLYVTPEALHYNITPSRVSTTPSSTGAVYPYPAQNLILRLDTSPAILAAGAPIGLKVSANALVRPN